MSRHRGRTPRGRQDGQALVEFSFVLIPFLLLLLGTFDVGRGIYLYNGVAEAAREVARVTSVHVGNPTGSQSETTAVVNQQRGLVPNLSAPTFSCVDAAGAAVGHAPCQGGDGVKVTMSAPFSVVTPLLGLIGPFTFASSSTMLIP